MLLGALVGALFTPTLLAHELRPAVADLTRTGDTLQIALRVNVEALLAGVGIEHEDTDDSPQAADYYALRALGPEALRARLEAFLPRLRDGLSLAVDGDAPLEPVLVAADIPPVGDTRVARDATLRFEAPLPPATTRLTWRWAKAFGPLIVRSGASDTPDAFAVYLLPGDTSEPLPLAAGSDASGTDTGAEPRKAGGGGGALLRTVLNYVRVGFVHIVPLGLDHVLFVTGLFLLSPRARPVLWQVSAFTLAHSVTLALGALGLLSVPARVVEPLIALSIVAVCVENLFTERLHRWRTLLVFGFGLLHGLGFAGVLGEVGMGATAFVTALISFNVGVELGQLTVIFACFALVGWSFRDRPWYRRVVTVPGSLAIGVTGLVWFVQRVLG